MFWSSTLYFTQHILFFFLNNLLDQQITTGVRYHDPMADIQESLQVIFKYKLYITQATIM